MRKNIGKRRCRFGGRQQPPLVVKGDVNGDGVCDSTDYMLLRTRVLSGESGFVNGIFDMAGDMNCDGYLDVLDMMMLERCVSGSNRNIEVI